MKIQECEEYVEKILMYSFIHGLLSNAVSKALRIVSGAQDESERIILPFRLSWMNEFFEWVGAANDRCLPTRENTTQKNESSITISDSSVSAF